MQEATKTALNILGGVVFGEDPLALPEGTMPDIVNLQEFQSWVGSSISFTYAFGSLTVPASAPGGGKNILFVAPIYKEQVYDKLIVGVEGGGIYTFTESGGYTATTSPPALSAAMPIVTANYLDTLWVVSTAAYAAYFDGSSWTTPTDLAAVAAGFVTTFYAHIILCRTIESTVACNHRVRWSVVGDPDDWSGETSGFVDLVDTPGRVLCAHTLLDRLIILKEDAMYEGVYVGAEDTFHFNKLNHSYGVVGPQAAKVFNNILYFLGQNNLYAYDGEEITTIGNGLEHLLVQTVDAQAKWMATLDASLRDSRLYLLMARTGVHSSDIWQCDLTSGAWWHISPPLSVVRKCLACLELPTAPKWGELGVLTWPLALNAWNSSAWVHPRSTVLVGYPGSVQALSFEFPANASYDPISSTWYSPEIAWEYAQRFFQFSVELKTRLPGYTTIVLSCSTDGGETWALVDGGGGTSTATRTFQEEEPTLETWTFDRTAQTIRFKLDMYGAPLLFRRITFRARNRKGDR